MDTLYLLQYNNYFNRIIKGYPTIDEYSSYVLVHAPEQNPVVNISFNPNDGVNTEQIVNWNGAMPDYVLVDHGDSFTRWYVIGHERTRANQYRLFLRRDLVMDYYRTIVTAPCFVEKATLNSNNNLIFNSEQMTFNQIKTSEVLLKDETKCPWIAIYGARYDHSGASDQQTPTTFEVDINTIYPYRDITYAEYQEILNNAQKGVFGYLDTVALYITEGAPAGTARRAYYMTQESLQPTSLTSGPTAQNSFVSNATAILENFREGTLYSVLQAGPAYVPNYNETLYDQILQLSDQFVRVQMPDGTYSFFKIGNSGVQTGVAPELGPITGNLLEIMAPIRQAFQYPNNVTIKGPEVNISSNVMIGYTGRLVRYTITPVQAPQAVGETLTIQADRYHLTDAPYDMFVIPFSSDLQIINSKITGWTKVKSDRYRALQAAGELLSKYSGTGQIIDAQILPYCPLPNARMTAAGELDINDSSSQCYSKITSTNTTVGYVLHCNVSSFQKSITLSNPIVIQDYKLESETDMYRLCSPNYSGAFEFNAAKNGGVTMINVSCTYKPYTPYIKLYPSFGRLYGSDFNDARGLICGGDYSIAALTDAWETYQLQNKNYQASFDRQIENLEIHNKFGLLSDIAGAIGGTAGGVASGFELGGPVGAVFGGLASAGAGAADVYINQRLRSEDLKYTKDQFGYQLGNIQALPQGLSKTSAYNVDNKYFPFLEYYTCSNEEKAALQNKLKYNGMTVMAIGTIEQYISPDERTYIKGQIIRLENINADYNVCREIYNEIHRGVFV